MIDMIRQAMTGDYVPHGNPDEAGVILAPSFGRDRDDLGLSNFAIAEFAIDAAEQHCIGIIAQFAVANAVAARGKAHLLEARIDPITDKDRRYMTSDHIIQRAIPIIAGRQTLIAPQGFHAARFDAQVQGNGIKSILPKGLPRNWDKHNILREIHCNSATLWRIREPAAVMQHAITGKFRQRKRAPAA